MKKILLTIAVLVGSQSVLAMDHMRHNKCMDANPAECGEMRKERMEDRKEGKMERMEKRKEMQSAHKMKAEQMWLQTDADKDGKIGRVEALAFAANKFDERDTNKDGFITKEEMASFYGQKMKHHKQMKKQMNK